MRFTITLVTSICLALAVSSSVGAQFSHNYTVDGRVTFAGGIHRDGVIRVQLRRLGMTMQEQYSRDGQFAFSAVSLGPYTIHVEFPGVEAVDRAIEVPGDRYIIIKLGTGRSSGHR